MLDTKDMKSTYCETMMQLVESDPRVIILEADLMTASGTRPIQDKHPDRVINVGVAEANMVGVAAGPSTCGYVPFADTFGAFASRRCYDQICISVAYSKQNVKIVGTDPGICAEHNGGTHMAMEDVGIMRTLSTMTVVEPCDNVQLRKAIPIIANHYGPLYMRLFRRQPHKIYSDDYEFVLGKADLLRYGADATIIAVGAVMVANALTAADILRERGIAVRVLNMHTIKPLDVEAVLKAAAETGAILTAENCNVTNGLGSAVAEVLAENMIAIPFKRIGVGERFGEVGNPPYLQEVFHFTPEDIIKTMETLLARK